MKLIFFFFFKNGYGPNVWLENKAWQ